MAFESNYPTRIDEVLDFINNEITNKIKNKVTWHSSNVPFGELKSNDQIAKFERDIRKAFGINSNLPKLSPKLDIKPGEPMDALDLFNKIKRIAYYWSSIRRVHIREEYDDNGTIKVWGDDTQYGKLTEDYSSEDYVNELEKEFVALKGQPTNAQQLKNLLLKFYEKWEQLPEITLTTKLCHSNCHGSCHHR